MSPRPAAGSVEIAEAIRARPAPLLFLDTAALFDILRACHRTDLPVGILKSAISLIGEIAGGKCGLVTSANVLNEAAKNRERV